jgi:hypothetical protein
MINTSNDMQSATGTGASQAPKRFLHAFTTQPCYDQRAAPEPSPPYFSGPAAPVHDIVTYFDRFLRFAVWNTSFDKT